MGRVLVVDDSLTVRMDMGEGLQAAGFDIVLCEDLRSARVALATNDTALIVLDVVLPDGDGLEFLRELKGTAATAGIPVLLLSTEAEVSSRIRGMGAGADEYVGKPYDIVQVIARARVLTRANAARGDVRRILVIDDSATFRNELATALEEAGFQVDQCASGEEGLAIIGALNPDAVVVDGMLPGIDGATVVRRLKSDSAFRTTPCVLLTAAEDAANELRALEAGADAYVRKSEDLGVILVRITALLRGSSTFGVPARPSLFGPKRLLAVDDSITYLEELGSQLRNEGYDVVLATSGEEALEFLAAQAVDCILLDLIMPGLSGTETCQRIKQTAAWRDTPLVILTASDDRAAMIEGINAGADDYIAKSADFDVLKARLRAQLRRKHFEDENRSIRDQLVRRETEVAAEEELKRYAAALERTNRELESFSYSIAHDLRAPLRSVEGFARALFEDQNDVLDADGQQHLSYIREAASHMSELIDDLLMLARVTTGELRRDEADITALAQGAIARLVRSGPARAIDVRIQEGMRADADARLLDAVFDNLLGNAWKFTSKCADVRIEVGATGEPQAPTYFVRDNGAGFDMAFADKLFAVFQRLHMSTEFEGTGVGLATVQRIIHRHGGRIWAEGTVGAGATFYFTLNDMRSI